ncbi:MAG TPA: CarD family transcriptional regulator [Alphaproteobacteria bacterium]|jgi:CarD family transcriptional regulator
MASKSKKGKKTGKAKAAVRSSSTAKKRAPAKQRPVSRAKARVQVKGTAARTKSPRRAPAGGRGDAHHATHRAAVKVPAKVPAKVPRPEPVKLIFAEGDHVVYPTHGVGRVTGIESAEIAGTRLQFYVILFDADKMTLKVPVEKAKVSGLRKISGRDKMQTAIVTLKGRARTKRTMWSRRAQEYEAKINSGDPVAIAEVVRDLHRNVGQPDQSYSERQMYEAALDRLSNEFALVEKVDKTVATERLETLLRAG